MAQWVRRVQTLFSLASPQLVAVQVALELVAMVVLVVAQGELLQAALELQDKALEAAMVNQLAHLRVAVAEQVPQVATAMVAKLEDRAAQEQPPL